MRLSANRLRELIGADNAELLMREMAGHTIPRLTPERLQRWQRDERIRQAKNAGESYRGIAARHGLAVARVVDICSSV